MEPDDGVPGGAGRQEERPAEIAAAFLDKVLKNAPLLTVRFWQRFCTLPGETPTLEAIWK